MKKISVDNIEDGMVLAKEVTGSTGNTLLGKGSTLSAAMGRRLKNWGIALVHIEGVDEVGGASENSTNSSKNVEKKLTQRFKDVKSLPHMSDIFDATLNFLNSYQEG